MNGRTSAGKVRCALSHDTELPRIGLLLIVLTCLIGNSGCLHSRNVLGKSRLAETQTPERGPQPTPGSDCAAPPVAVTKPLALTTLPVPPDASNQQSPLRVPSVRIESSEPASAPQSVKASGSVESPVVDAAAQQLAGVPPLTSAIIEPVAESLAQVSQPGMTAIPSRSAPIAAGDPTQVAACPPGEGYRSERNVAIPHAMPDKLAICEKQMMLMNERLTALQADAAQTHTKLEQMSREQVRLRSDNQRLRVQIEMSDRQYLNEMDSLSRIISEAIEAESGPPDSVSLNESRDTADSVPAPAAELAP